jgi:hypothetical protein
LTNVWSESTYANFIVQLPPPAVYQQFKHLDSTYEGKGTRNHLWLDDGINRIPAKSRPFWSEIATALSSPELQYLMFRKLQVPASVEATARPLLVRDTDGYKINPHPDTPKKVVTVQFYLPADDSRPHLGTELYRRDGQSFTAVNQVPFRPHYGYAFRVTKESWHGVPRRDLSAGARDSLMVLYYRS